MPPSHSIATISEGRPAPGDARVSPQRERIREAFLELALQDRIVITYHGLVFFGVVLALPSPDWSWAVSVTMLLWASLTAVLLAVRAELIQSAFWRATVYRIFLIGSVQASYVLMRNLLPIINPGALDAELYRLDLTLFGFEPAVAFAPWVTPAMTEWFSFVYYGYFLLLLLHLWPLVITTSHTRARAELTLGLTIVFCIGQALYMVVPGYGPGVGLPHLFEHPLPVGFFGRLVNDTVESWGAQKDIFPSIHTAVPTFLCLWSYRFRHARLFSRDGVLRALYANRAGSALLDRLWIFTTLFSLNVMVATMYLRWHYLIDVVAGLLLGVFGFWLSTNLGQKELVARKERGLSAIWPYFSKT